MSTDSAQILLATQELREIIETREKRLAENRHVNYSMLGGKGTKLFFSSLKARTVRSKINLLGIDTDMTTNPQEITTRINNYFTNAFSEKKLHDKISNQTDLDVIKNILTDGQKEWLKTDYNTTEIKHAVDQLKNESSPGMDG